MTAAMTPVMLQAQARPGWERQRLLDGRRLGSPWIRRLPGTPKEQAARGARPLSVEPSLESGDAAEADCCQCSGRMTAMAFERNFPVIAASPP